MIRKKNNDKLKFFYLGKKNNYKKLLDKKLVSEINSLYHDQLKKYYYD